MGDLELDPDRDFKGVRRTDPLRGIVFCFHKVKAPHHELEMTKQELNGRE